MDEIYSDLHLNHARDVPGPRRARDRPTEQLSRLPHASDPPHTTGDGPIRRPVRTIIMRAPTGASSSAPSLQTLQSPGPVGHGDRGRERGRLRAGAGRDAAGGRRGPGPRPGRRRHGGARRADDGERGGGVAPGAPRRLGGPGGRPGPGGRAAGAGRDGRGRAAGGPGGSHGPPGGPPSRHCPPLPAPPRPPPPRATLACTAGGADRRGR